MPALSKLKKLSQLIRYDILTSTSAAGSGHPTSSLSAVELMTTLFFGVASNAIDRFFNTNDRIIFSKGHASPLLYSLYHAAGIITYEELLKLRTFNSNLEGHPTPRFPYVDVATGSLGQGLSIGVGMALAIKKLSVSGYLLSGKTQITNPRSQITLPRVFVLLGDSEMAEGQVWEAIQIASYYKLNNLIGILDVNRLGQRGETMLGWNIKTYQKRIESFGWKTIIIEDGNNLEQVYSTFQNALSPIPYSLTPIMLIAKTVKGKGVSFLENKNGWHGKTLNNEQLELALKEIGNVDLNVRGKILNSTTCEIRNEKIDNEIRSANQLISLRTSEIQLPISHITPHYNLTDLVATREAYGNALVELGKINPDVIVLDAETSNSTYTDKFKNAFPDRFFEMFIAEQNMISTALGFSKLGYIPFVSSFAAFLTRGFDQIRMAQYSNANLKIVGSHCGVSIGPDGPSQMALEDLAMFRSILNSIIFYPSDAVSTHQLTQIMANNDGIYYLRTTREKTPIIYKNNEKFTVGGSKIHSTKGQLSVVNCQLLKPKVLIISAGITLHEALKAQKELAKIGIETIVLDCYSIKPIDKKTIQQLITDIKNIIVVEDHYPYGGLGEAVKSVISNKIIHLAVSKTPRSGTPSELLYYEEIDSQAIIAKVLKMI